MPLPIGPERLVFAGETQRFPLPLRGNEFVVGRLAVGTLGPFGDADHVDQDTWDAIVVTHVLVDRSFQYKVAKDDAMALFIPENKIRPHVEIGDWYYGPNTIYQYISNSGSMPDLPQGILFARRTARVWWCAEGVSSASYAGVALRPVYWASQQAPVEFRTFGAEDCNVPPISCDQ